MMMMMMMMMMMIVRECLNSAAARRTLPVQSPHLYSALQTGDYSHRECLGFTADL